MTGGTWVILIVPTLGHGVTLAPTLRLFQERNNSDTVSDGGNTLLAIGRNLNRNVNYYLDLCDVKRELTLSSCLEHSVEGR